MLFNRNLILTEEWYSYSPKSPHLTLIATFTRLVTIREPSTELLFVKLLLDKRNGGFLAKIWPTFSILSQYCAMVWFPKPLSGINFKPFSSNSFASFSSRKGNGSRMKPFAHLNNIWGESGLSLRLSLHKTIHKINA